MSLSKSSCRSACTRPMPRLPVGTSICRRAMRTSAAIEVCDFTFGNPHEMPLPNLVAAIRQRAIHDRTGSPKTSEESRRLFSPACQPRARACLRAADIALTAGAFAPSWWRSVCCSMPATRPCSPSRPGSATSRCACGRCGTAQGCPEGALIRSRPCGDRGRDRAEDAARDRQLAAQSDRAYL